MSDKLRFQIEKLVKALKQFETAITEDEGDVKSRNSLLLCYVFTFEMAWRAMREWLAARGERTPDFAAAVLRTAFQAQLIDDVSGWEKLKDHRNNVSHAYDESLAIQIAAHVRQYAAPLFHQLTARLERDD